MNKEEVVWGISVEDFLNIAEEELSDVMGCQVADEEYVSAVAKLAIRDFNIEDWSEYVLSAVRQAIIEIGDAQK